MIWRVYDKDDYLVAEVDDLYEAELLAEAVGGRVCMM